MTENRQNATLEVCSTYKATTILRPGSLLPWHPGRSFLGNQDSVGTGRLWVNFSPFPTNDPRVRS
jgi:hypothetical protein